MRNLFVMFVTAVCFFFLLKLKWPKDKTFYDIISCHIYFRLNTLIGTAKSPAVDLSSLNTTSTPSLVYAPPSPRREHARHFPPS